MVRCDDPTPHIGKTYNSLTVLSTYMKQVSPDRRRRYAICRCVCGNVYEGRLCQITNGDRISCGCKRKTHINLDLNKREYSSWYNMKERCYTIDNINYKNYGGRGIKVCDRWLNSFENFIEDMGERPEGTSIDRIDNNGNYEPSNCKWSTQKEQMRNFRKNVYVTYKRKKVLLIELCEKHNISYSRVYNRIFTHGWDIDKALTTSIRGHKPYKSRNI